MDTLRIASMRFALKGQIERSIPSAITLVVEGWRFPDALDIEEFVKSLTHTGLAPLFTCATCGQFCCSGYYVGIEITEQYWIMRNAYDCADSEKVIDSFEYHIPWWQIKQVLAQIRQALADVPEKQPHLAADQGSYSIFPSVAQFDALTRQLKF